MLLSGRKGLRKDRAFTVSRVRPLHAQIVRDGEIYEACRGLKIGCIAHELGCQDGTRKAARVRAGRSGVSGAGSIVLFDALDQMPQMPKLDYAPPYAVAGRACKFCVTSDLL